jgi:chromosomal replication initiation ATPase DnaA
MSKALMARLERLEARVAELEGEVLARPSLARVLDEVAEAFATRISEIRAPWRNQRLMPARQAAVLLARRHTRLPLQVIARAMARDHTTVLHNLAEAERRQIEDPQFAARIQAVSERLQRSMSDA